MGLTKRLLYALLRMSISLVMSIIIPLWLFGSVKNIPDILGMEITLEQQVYDSIVFWIIAIGMITVSLTFAKHSSPKRSPQRAIFGIFNIFANMFYIYSYKFSGASQLTYTIQNYGSIAFDVGVMLNLWMGLIFLKIILEVYDLVDGIIYQRNARNILEDGIPETVENGDIEYQNGEEETQK
jgi:hypothetical protein